MVVPTVMLSTEAQDAEVTATLHNVTAVHLPPVGAQESPTVRHQMSPDHSITHAWIRCDPSVVTADHEQ